MRLLIFWGLIFLTYSCGQKQNENADFLELRENLPQIETPITFDSNSDIALKSIDLPNNQILKGLKDRNYFSVLGKVFETKDFITIVGYIPDDFGTPILVTLDKDGNQIDSFSLYKTVGFDMGYYRSNFVTINSDKTIVLIDSLLTLEINEDRTDEILGTDSLTVTKNKFRLTDKGTIEIIE
jgi:hypothetical protein